MTSPFSLPVVVRLGEECNIEPLHQAVRANEYFRDLKKSVEENMEALKNEILDIRKLIRIKHKEIKLLNMRINLKQEQCKTGCMKIGTHNPVRELSGPGDNGEYEFICPTCGTS